MTQQEIQNQITKYHQEGIFDFGLRAIKDGLSTIGSPVNNSYHWEDGINTGVKMDGASTIGFDVDEIDGEVDFASFEKALSTMSEYGDNIVVIGGKENLNEIHNDIGERVILDGIIVANVVG